MTFERSRRGCVALVCSCALLFAAGGCSTKIYLPTPPKPDVAPLAATPVDAIQRLEWSWGHRSVEPCRDLFACDYEFTFAPTDTSGIRFRDRPWTRPDELSFALHLFETGSALAPPASRVELQLERDLVPQADERPGRDPRWHQRIETLFIMVIDSPAAEFRVAGTERFYLVRGDSACIPQELRDRGFGPDSTRWWIERWDEEGLAGSTLRTPARAQPLGLFSLGTVKSLYLDPPPAP